MSAGAATCVHSALHSRHKVFSGNIGKGREEGSRVQGGDGVKSLLFVEEWGEIREKENGEEIHICVLHQPVVCRR